ncbi:hypothetical protein [Burkholderia gladioli]|uniref:hypothetical protein n=1 Tax=Burkholderia gladioli TaxID=28095 RepID=UPI00163E4EAA|nr:hypothetical protein [Burkholderia gladioli]
MKKPSNAAVANENVGRLASIGLSAIQVNHARCSVNRARRSLIASRKLLDNPDTPATEIDEQLAGAIKARKIALDRLRREIARYQQWLAKVNGGTR